VSKGARLGVMLLAALAAIQAISAEPAEAASTPPPLNLCPLVWTGTYLSDTKYDTSCADQLNGGGGHDRLYGRESADKLIGDIGNDYLYGEGGNDTLQGGSGDDTTKTEAGGGTVYADIGNDAIVADHGSRDNIYAGDGNDTIYITTSFDGQVDVYDGGPGTDTVVDSSRCFYPNWPTDPIDTYVSIENRHPNVC
jgi:RTX calcium-binding nonapeptide repeat (4 copies)